MCNFDRRFTCFYFSSGWIGMKTKVMGIVNITPDSFSDGGRFYRPEEAIRRAKNLISEGADIIDLGAESTRPGAEPISWQTEWDRLAPVLEGLSPAEKGSVPVSIDTYHPETAERALDMGASIINCVFEGSVPAMLEICTKKHAEIVIPARTLQGSVPNIKGTVPCSGGTVPCYFDPMIGFGTTREQDLELLRAIPELAKRGRVLVGVSRKRIVKKLTGEKITGKNLGGNLGMALWCARHGASVLRVHDVLETVQALKVTETLDED